MSAALDRLQLFARIKDDLPPQRFLDYREYLRASYLWLKERLERYSYLHFADDLGFSHTNVLHLVIRGKRTLSTNGAKRIGKAFGFSPEDLTYLVTLCEYQNAKDATVRELFHKRLIELRGETPTSLTSLTIARELLPEVQREVEAFNRRLDELARRADASGGDCYVLSLRLAPSAP